MTKKTRSWIIVGVVVALIIGGATGAALTLTGNSTPTHSAQANCDSSGCGLVSQSLSQVQPTGFYGASCSGAYGDWFLKIMQEGKADQLRANYYLHWTSSSGSAAHPSGSVVVRPVTGAKTASHVTITINDGKMTIAGTAEPSKTQVKATGTLTVTVVSQKGSSSLELTESGLAKAEQQLGLNSPFNYKGQPLQLLIRTVQVLVGC